MESVTNSVGLRSCNPLRNVSVLHFVQRCLGACSNLSRHWRVVNSLCYIAQLFEFSISSDLNLKKTGSLLCTINSKQYILTGIRRACLLVGCIVAVCFLQDCYFARLYDTVTTAFIFLLLFSLGPNVYGTYSGYHSREVGTKRQHAIQHRTGWKRVRVSLKFHWNP